jgi:hypothetical protein
MQHDERPSQASCQGDNRGVAGPQETAGVGRERVERTRRRLRERVTAALEARLSPERTRRATLLERLTVRRLSWDLLVRFNRSLAFLGKAATALWCAFLASVVLGVDWKQTVDDALNSGKPVEGAFAITIIVPTLLFIAARSMIGFWRWRLQRELWRRDVERLSR